MKPGIQIKTMEELVQESNQKAEELELKSQINALKERYLGPALKMSAQISYLASMAEIADNRGDKESVVQITKEMLKLVAG